MRIILILGALLVSGCSSNKAPADSFDTLRSEIDLRVAEAARAEKMQDAVESMERGMDGLLELSAETAAELAALVDDYDSSRQAFDALSADYAEKRRAIVDRMLVAHLALKQQATADEWKRLSKKAHETVARVGRQNLAPSANN